MQWFKHMSTMRYDVRIQRLIRKHGLEGYGLYNVIIESVVGGLSDQNPLPDLEEESRDIAEYFNSDTAKIEDIIHFCIDEGLLDYDEVKGRIIAHKVYKYLQQSATSNKKLRNMIANYKKLTQGDQSQKEGQSEKGDLSQTVMTFCDPVTENMTPSQENVNRTEEKRKEENRSEETASPEPDGSSGDDSQDTPKREMHPLKDTTADYWQRKLTELQPVSTWGNIGKERAQCGNLAKMTRALLDDVPFDSAEQLIDALIQQYIRMRKQHRASFWSSAPFVPSAVILRWSTLTAALAERWEKEVKARRYQPDEDDIGRLLK